MLHKIYLATACFTLLLLAVAFNVISIHSYAQTSPGAQEQFTVIKNTRFGFQFELPSEWQRKINRIGALVMYGASGTQAEQAITILQILDKSVLTGSTDSGELSKLYQQIKHQPGFRFISEGHTSVAGSNAPFFLVSYHAEDETGRTVTFRHTHIALDQKEYFLLMSYRAPESLFDTYIWYFEHIKDTFSTFPINSEKRMVKQSGLISP